MPSAVRHPVDPRRGRHPLLPSLCLTVEAERAPRTRVLLGEAARSLLTAIGAPPALAHRAAEAARLGADYVTGRSERPRCRLWIHTDAEGVTVTVTDHMGTGAPREPAWLAVPPTAPEPEPGDECSGHSMTPHRTAEGHIRLVCRTPLAADGAP